MLQENTTKKIRITARALLLNYDRTHMLLVRHTGSTALSTPGGGMEEVDVHIPDCLKRELKEELGVEALIERLAFSREFIKQEKTVIEFYFLASLPLCLDIDLQYQDTAYEDGVGGVEERIWVAIKDIEQVNVLPLNVKDIEKIIDNTLAYRHNTTTHFDVAEENIFI